MPSDRSPRDIAVLGAGVAGLTVALELLKLGERVSIIDSRIGAGASNVAAGMLAPASEANFGETILTEMMLEASIYWEPFHLGLEEISKLSVDYRTSGTLVVAADQGDMADLERSASYLTGVGMDVRELRRSEVRDVEPLLGSDLAGVFKVVGDHQVHNRHLIAALTRAFQNLGGNWINGLVENIAERENGIELRLSIEQSDLNSAHVPSGATTKDPLYFDSCLIASGAWSATICDLIGAESVSRNLMPVKGQILRIRAEQHYGPPEHVIRGSVNGRHVYLVPRLDGEVVVGATMEEVGFDSGQRIGAISDMLEDATRLVPSVREAEFRESSVGFRPGTSDNLPVLGRLTTRIWAHFGHFRHGILLSPLTARYTAAAIVGHEVPPWFVSCSPERFATGVNEG
ncbi:MAG: glycine oxidase ThiO [Acidimicrobiaceae bacterium]|nr:glycine oxidase ThiO [Acidimicrobiaceae bacterium]